MRWVRCFVPVVVLSGTAALCAATAAPGEKAIPVTGAAEPRLASFDRMMVKFLEERPEIRGAALAVGRHGRLIYSRGYGYADLERKHPVQPDSLFRIASVSKPLTAVAVLQLAEQGKLKLDDKVFDVLKPEEPKGKGVEFDPRWHRVTIQHLLQHTGGWDRGKAFDPMFVNDDVCKTLGVPSPATQGDIIRYMLRKPLQSDPGTHYAYSNFGYCLLGRVIEKVSGQSYEDYVRKHVLQPVGARDTRLGRTLRKERAEREVEYDCGGRRGDAILGPNRGKPVPLPYGVWSLEAMDSHGGWIASAPDLVRFAAAFDHPSRCKLLNAASIQTMFAPPPGDLGHRQDGTVKAVYYGCGWQVRPYPSGKNTWHTGLLAGTSTLLVRRNDGLSWAVLFNGSGDRKNGQPASAIDPLVHEAANAVREWPESPRE
jgi:CubicO group peptidase (beta-lactamase class C family)